MRKGLYYEMLHQRSIKRLAMVTGLPYLLTRPDAFGGRPDFQEICSGTRLPSARTPARTARRLSEVVRGRHNAFIAFTAVI